MAAKHTPGPWTVGDWKGWSAMVRDGNGDGICIPCTGRGGTNDANARLIAAAPELLEIVRDVQDYSFSKFSGRIRDVLAKIDGEP
jgi:hypothetical protein